MLVHRALRGTGRLTVSGVMAVTLVGACAPGGGSRSEGSATHSAPVSAGAGAPSADPGPDAGGADAGADTSADNVVDYVVAISVDGLNPTAIRRLGPSGAPAFHRMLGNGSTTLNARTEYEQTRTLPNHSGMVTGRPILGPRGHGATFNSDNGRTVRESAGAYVSSMFDQVHDSGGSTAFYSAKTKLDFLDRSWNARHGRPDAVGVDNGRDKIDRYIVDDEPSNVTRLVNRLHAAPDELSFVHVAYPDRAGHAYGFMSARYLQAVRQTDRQLGRILDAVRADTRLRRHLDVVLTADHGGYGAGHSDMTKAYNYTVPFMAWGVGVARNADLYALNAGSRKRPGVGRPTYAGRQPIRNAEVANLAVDLLDLPSVPGSVFDRGQRLSLR